MKTLILIFAFLLQTALVFAGNDRTILAQARNENVKMYLQAGTGSPVVKSLSTQDRIEVIRKFNKEWTIVVVDGQVGYVLHCEIGKPEFKTLAVAKNNRKTE